jgi:hypothetical protein
VRVMFTRGLETPPNVTTTCCVPGGAEMGMATFKSRSQTKVCFTNDCRHELRRG